MENLMSNFSKQTLSLEDLKRKEIINILNACVDQLEPIQKRVIRLRFWEEMTINQIAILTHKSWEQIDHLIEQTLTELRQMLAGHLGLQAASKEAA